MLRLLSLYCPASSFPILFCSHGDNRSHRKGLSMCASGLDEEASSGRATAMKSIVSAPAYWQRPSEGWICLNTDGAVSSGTGIGSIGGIFRDHESSWILGFNKRIGTQPLQAELWAILIGLQLAWSYGFERLIIQTDNEEAIQLLHDPNARMSSNSLVRAIDGFAAKVG